jgi:glyoxylase-like metal-dependent hydrolase (beta-lactamase superfamily II)
MLQTKHFTFNPFQENTWIIWNNHKKCLIIDPGCYTQNEKEVLLQFIDDNQLIPVRLLNTHCHIDHVLGNPFIQQKFGLVPEIHPLEIPILNAVEQYGSLWGINSEKQPAPLASLNDGDRIYLDEEYLNIIYTPGHSPGEVCFYSEKNNFLIGGDVLFFESIGRTDLPGGNHSQLIESIKQHLFSLPDATIVHCGHGNSTSIGHEKKCNPFLT